MSFVKKMGLEILGVIRIGKQRTLPADEWSEQR